jgi:hypothetical protein
MDQALHKAGAFLSLLHQVQLQVVALDFKMTDLKIMVVQLVVQVLQYLQ